MLNNNHLYGGAGRIFTVRPSGTGGGAFSRKKLGYRVGKER